MNTSPPHRQGSEVTYFIANLLKIFIDMANHNVKGTSPICGSRFTLVTEWYR